MSNLHRWHAWGVSLIAYGVVAIFLLPIIWMISTSLSSPIEFISSSIRLWPLEPTLEHYRTLFQEDHVLTRVGNSVIVTLGSSFLALCVGFPAAYGLVRLRFPARLDMMFLIFVLVVKLAPPITLAIPLYQVLSLFGLLDTLLGLVIVYQVLTLPYAIWMLIGFVRDVPLSYEEAAMIDGAGLFTRLFWIVLPVMRPGLISTTILLMIVCWNEFLYALLFIQTPSRFPLSTYIATLITEDETFWGKLSSVGFIASLPILLLVVIVQRGLTKGFSGGVK